MYVKDKVSKLPLPVVPAALGLLVLSGVYDTLGFPIVHWLAVAAATAVVVLYALKIAFHLRSVVAAEYANPMLAALYPTVPMLVMVLCVFYAQLFPAAWAAAQAVFFAMLGCCACMWRCSSPGFSCGGSNGRRSCPAGTSPRTG